MRVLRHRQGAVRSISDAAVNRGSGEYYRTREITALGACVEWLRAEDRRPNSMSGFQPDRPDRCRCGPAAGYTPSEWHSERCSPIASDRMPDVDSPDHSATVLISTSRTALIVRAQPCTVSRVLSVAYATHENKKTRRPYDVRRCGISVQKKPHDTAGLFRKPSTLASPFGVPAAAR